ncbi:MULTISPECIES: excinuclease ABC subunit UvrA [Dehalobacter]|uniref:UvrABC system protein A n=1 Tax=Dehalobacter restrictus (strain DSM 9455 / PER-K23) TaxID=871738 RepID=A0ABM5P8S8_DEHRP|nr:MULTISPECIES: excinuclease ABC subunit UvrA [Dehalobacter]AHF11055.1 excinuclease ABC subunit A [Dehalobacter restrictus DSM 9455]MDJ0305198.1 excinuclease ABC subunit UvrA [Dehalobacter sp.]OCZ53917.1 excinuclease ABC subunit A [Dehalobacter sp. TeCB1]
MTQDYIKVRGARVHNLKNIDVDIPRDKLVVITGLSGSGKSSLAFDTIYAEGQRRYVESLSAYARQFLGQMDKPDVDYIEGLSPAISIDQKTTNRNPRSTVGTVTEIYDYLRLLYARVGHPHCPNCGKEISQQTVQQMVDQLLTYPEKTRLQILAPVIKGKKGEHVRTLEQVRKSGYVRVRVDGEVRDLSEEILLEKNKKHSIDVVVDRISLKPDSTARLADSIETALKLAEGTVLVDIAGQEEILFSENFACPDCGIAIDEIAPRLFSFNSPFGACPSCTGLGANLEADIDLIISDRGKSINEGAIVPWAKSNLSYYPALLQGLAEKFGFSLDCPVKNLTPEQWQVLVYGSDSPIKFSYYNIFDELKYWKAPFEGLVPYFNRRYKESTSDYVRNEIEGLMTERPCPVCQGKRLKPEALAVKINRLSIYELTRLTVMESLDFFKKMVLSEKEQMIARQVLKEIKERLGFLVNVGLDYLTLDRAAGTLSGGEAQRIRLATQIGSSLTGVLYVLDEPSIGLHQRDNAKLLDTLKKLRDLGNTLLVVEHDEDTLLEADHIIDIGPGAGTHGGHIVAQGDLEAIKACEASITGQYQTGRKKIEVPAQRRQPNGKWLEVVGAAQNNLKQLHAKFPLGVMTCVTGVSGSGKSTLVNEILFKGLQMELKISSKVRPGVYRELKGLEYVDKVIDIDQSPIGRTPRSNPATYTGLFDFIRDLFSQTPEAKIRGYKQGRFSFNVKGGRCEACRGDGIIKIEMHFLPDVYVPCEVCRGQRYNRETLEVSFKGKNIAEILNMTVAEAVEFFAAVPRIARKLQTLQDVGLGYIKLGQPATTLSGGEAQRVKLATELSRRSTGKTLYILDEPTTGLHVADVDKLLKVLQRLVEAGDSVLIIEHNLDVIKTADYIIDLGPEGGSRGGEIVAVGTPEEIAAVPASYTGQFLGKHLGI